MASDNRKTHESTLEQPNRMTDIVLINLRYRACTKHSVRLMGPEDSW